MGSLGHGLSRNKFSIRINLGLRLQESGWLAQVQLVRCFGEVRTLSKITILWAMGCV